MAFTASATGSVTRSVFDNCERAVMATDSSPVVNNNTVQKAVVGFVFYRSSTVLADNVVLRATAAAPGADASPGGAAFGVLVDSAPSALIQGNTFDVLVGGRGGDGAENPGGAGGRGGTGGPAA